MNNTLSRLFLAVILCGMLASCSLFRKKNKCMSCPKWNDHIELESGLTLPETASDVSWP